MVKVVGSLCVLKKDSEEYVAVYPLVSGKPVSIGKDKNCDIRIHLPTASVLHCRLDVTDNVQATNLDETEQNRTLLNGTAFGVNTAVDLKDQDVLEICKRRFRFQLAPPSTPVRPFSVQNGAASVENDADAKCGDVQINTVADDWLPTATSSSYKPLPFVAARFHGTQSVPPKSKLPVKTLPPHGRPPPLTAAKPPRLGGTASRIPSFASALKAREKPAATRIPTFVSALDAARAKSTTPTALKGAPRPSPRASPISQTRVANSPRPSPTTMAAKMARTTPRSVPKGATSSVTARSVQKASPSPTPKNRALVSVASASPTAVRRFSPAWAAPSPKLKTPTPKRGGDLITFSPATALAERERRAARPPERYSPPLSSVSLLSSPTSEPKARLSSFSTPEATEGNESFKTPRQKLAANESVETPKLERMESETGSDDVFRESSPTKRKRSRSLSPRVRTSVSLHEQLSVFRTSSSTEPVPQELDELESMSELVGIPGSSFSASASSRRSTPMSRRRANRSVTFGKPLTPEEFDRDAPPLTPVKRGGRPMSTAPRKSLLKKRRASKTPPRTPSQAGEEQERTPVGEELPTSPPRRASSRKAVSRRASPSFETDEAHSPPRRSRSVDASSSTSFFASPSRSMLSGSNFHTPRSPGEMAVSALGDSLHISAAARVSPLSSTPRSGVRRSVKTPREFVKSPKSPRVGSSEKKRVVHSDLEESMSSPPPEKKKRSSAPPSPLLDGVRRMMRTLKTSAPMTPPLTGLRRMMETPRGVDDLVEGAAAEKRASSMPVDLSECEEDGAAAPRTSSTPRLAKTSSACVKSPPSGGSMRKKERESIEESYTSPTEKRASTQPLFDPLEHDAPEEAVSPRPAANMRRSMSASKASVEEEEVQESMASSRGALQNSPAARAEGAMSPRLAGIRRFMKTPTNATAPLTPLSGLRLVPTPDSMVTEEESKNEVSSAEKRRSAERVDSVGDEHTASPRLGGLRRLMKTPVNAPSPQTPLSGVRRMMGTPTAAILDADMQAAEEASLLRTPRKTRSSLPPHVDHDAAETVPNAERTSPHAPSPRLDGLKRIFHETSRASPLIDGVKHLFDRNTPREHVFEEGDLGALFTDAKGDVSARPPSPVRRLFPPATGKTPTPEREGGKKHVRFAPSGDESMSGKEPKKTAPRVLTPQRASPRRRVSPKRRDAVPEIRVEGVPVKGRGRAKAQVMKIVEPAPPPAEAAKKQPRSKKAAGGTALGLSPAQQRGRARKNTVTPSDEAAPVTPVVVEQQLVAPASSGRRRGRPKKATTPLAIVDETPNKKRGRPPKVAAAQRKRKATSPQRSPPKLRRKAAVPVAPIPQRPAPKLRGKAATRQQVEEVEVPPPIPRNLRRKAAVKQDDAAPLVEAAPLPKKTAKPAATKKAAVEKKAASPLLAEAPANGRRQRKTTSADAGESSGVTSAPAVVVPKGRKRPAAPVDEPEVPEPPKGRRAAATRVSPVQRRAPSARARKVPKLVDV